MTDLAKTAKTCRHCSKLFARRTHESSRHYAIRQYCSPTCQDARKGATKKSRLSCDPAPPAVKTCEVCGTRCRRVPNRSTREWTMQRYCSLDCANRGKRQVIAAKKDAGEKVERAPPWTEDEMRRLRAGLTAKLGAILDQFPGRSYPAIREQRRRLREGAPPAAVVSYATLANVPSVAEVKRLHLKGVPLTHIAALTGLPYREVSAAVGQGAQ